MGRDHDRSSYPTVVIVTRLHVTILKYTRDTSFSSHGSPYDLLHSPLAHVCTLSSLHMSARRDARTDGIDQPGAQGDYQRDTAFVISTPINKFTLIPILTSYAFILCPEQQEPVSHCERHDMI